MSVTPAKNKRLLSIILTVIIVVAIGGAYINVSKGHGAHPRNLSQIKIDGTVLPSPKVIEPFQLVDNNGKPFTKQNLLNHWTFLFFGYTSCTYVCPVTMAEFRKLYVDLRAQLPDRLLPQVVFVSVDPQRDTIARLNQYVKSFDPHFIGLRGTVDEVTALSKQMNVSFHRVEGDDSENYMIVHTATVMLLNPQGNLVAYFSYPHEAVEMTKDYESVIRSIG